MGIAVPEITMGRMCECGRGRVPSNLVVCYACLDDLRAAFWAAYNADPPAHGAQAAERTEVVPAKRPGTPGSVRAAGRVTAPRARGAARY